MVRKRFPLVLVCFLMFLLLPVIVFARPLADTAFTAVGHAAEGGTPPAILVDENVADMTVQNAKVWWWFVSPCAPTNASETGAWHVEEIGRIATTGGLTRTLYSHDVPSPYCGDWAPEILSNVTADDNNLYWMSNQFDGLVELSVNANVGDPASPVYTDQSQADEIEERGNFVYLMDDAYGIIQVNKNSGAGVTIVTAGQLGGPSRDLQVTDDYVYWNQAGFLKVAALGGGGDGITTSVTDHIVENSLCPPGGPCPTTEYTFIAQGETIRRYDLDAGALGPILYDSPVAGAIIDDMALDDNYIYFFEGRQTSCSPFCVYDYGLYRMSRSGGAASLLYILSDQIFSGQDFDLTIGGPGNDYLFWHDSGQLKRLPANVAAIPSIDVLITDIEVTQAIQDLNDSVSLIRDKRTGVRVHVDAVGQNVEGITAVLYRINSVGTVIAGPIAPSNGTTYLTVPSNPNRATFNHAFYFQLPQDWIDDATLRLRAEINPNKLPSEPNYANNVQSTTTFTMLPSPTLRTHLLVWGYDVGGTHYQPDTVQDVWQARSWIRRVYPLASTPGGYDSPEPGFRLSIRNINSSSLGAHVQRTSDLCDTLDEDDKEFCAATFTNNCANWLRATEGIPNDEMIYSMIWDEPALPFPRGFASGNVSSGPTGTSTWGWDNDGSYGDWYMGHEVGHNVGRGHPSQGNACGHSASDPGYPYTGAAIGNGSMWGFDVGDVGLNGSLVPRVYPNSSWRDMMSYCNNQWISDYTYEGIYDFLTSGLMQSAQAKSTQAVRAGTDYIALFGTIYDDSDTAGFQLVGLWDSPGPYTAPVGGPFTMRLLDSASGELASYDFDGDASDVDPDNYAFTVVVPFPLSTSKVELRRQSDDALLATHMISANPPTIGNVQLVGASDPVTGTVTLQWEASDPDGDSLMFDVYYSDDNGATYAAYALAMTESTIQLDTLSMGGSSQARFRVTASDGTRLAEAESQPFVMANKPPSVTILTPQDGWEVLYGTAVNFEGEVLDVQGHVPDANIHWLVNGVDTGITGPYYTAYLLPVGDNEISLQATNTVGLMSEKTVTVIVNDDVAYPGPLLAVGPDQVSWQVVTGTTELQQATLDISNIGTGSLSWTASEDAAWLSLDSSSGSTPDTLTLVADPTQVPVGTPVDTVITIEGDNGQTLQLPVSLLIGITPPWGEPDSDSMNIIYLPILIH